MRLFIIVTLVSIVGFSTVWADACDPETCTPSPVPTETYTPTITPTPTNTPTPTPDVEILMTLPPPNATLVGTPGTPVPGQPAIFALRADAGDFMNSLLLFAIWVTQLVFGMLTLFRKR